MKVGALALFVGLVAAGTGACTAILGTEDRYYAAGDAAASERDASSGADATTHTRDAGEDVTDAAAPDADANADADADTEASSDAGLDASDENVISNPGFEDGIIDSNCGIGWNVEYAASITTSPLARSGAASCLICNSGSSLGYLAMDLPVPEAGAVIVASAWFAVPPPADADAGTTSVGVAVCYQGCDTMYSANYTPSPVPSWTILRGQQVTVQPDATQAQLQIGVETGCVLVDDVSVVYQ